MATENWNESNLQQIPGFYNRFEIKAKERINSKKNGIVAMPVKSDWGPVNKVISIKSEKDLKNIFNDNMNLTAFKLGKLALLGNPKEVLLYRLVDGNEKCGELILTSNEESSTNLIEITTKYPSDRSFSITIRDNLVEEGTKDLILYESTRQLFKIEALSEDLDELVSRINNNIENEYVVVKKLDGVSGTLKNIANAKFTGGNNGTESITMEHYLNAMSEFEGYKINAFVLDGECEPGLHKCAEEWLKRTKENGLDIMLFLGGNPIEKIDQANTRSIEFNNSNIINVFSNGYYEGIKYNSAEVAVYIAALAVGQDLIECLCNQVTIFDEVEPRLSKAEVESALNSGTLVLKKEDDQVVVVDDVNTLKQDKKNKSILGYIRTIKFLNIVNEDTTIFKKDYVGKTPNDSTGQTVIVCGLKKYFENLNKAGIIDDFTVEIDKDLQENAASDEFFWKWDAKYVNVIKKIYGSGLVRE